MQWGGVAIFLFHGIEDGVQTEVRNYTRKHLPKDDFIVTVRNFNARGTAVSMDDIIADRRGERPLPPYAFAVTFDDGFESSLTIAAPILAEEDVPATFYVTTAYIDSNRMSWIDRIEYVIEEIPSGKLQLPWGERRFLDPAEKQDVLEDIRVHVKSDQSINPDGIASEIQFQLGFDEVWSSDHPLGSANVCFQG